MPDPRVQTAIDLAIKLGTYNKIDRSAQYQDASQPALLRSHNQQWAAFRAKSDSDDLKIWILGGALAGCWTVMLVLVEMLLRG